MVTERGCQESAATNNSKIIRQFAHFLKQENGMDSLEPTEATPYGAPSVIVFIVRI